MNKRIILILVALAGVFGMAQAQSRKAVRINEVMVKNDSTSIADEYGRYSAWIELFNSNFAPIEISSIYLTTDTAHKAKYPVPLGDVNTRIPKRQHVVFFADGEPNKGTFHTNFVLVPGQDNYIAILDADGSVIDEVVVPASVLPGQTYARTLDGAGEWAVRDGSDASYITPSGANVIRDTNKKIEDFAERDSNGFGMTVMAMAIVFTALLVLCLSFYAIGKIGSFVSRANKARTATADSDTNLTARDVEHDTGDVIAAIAMALHEHLDAHDRENTVLTINKVKKAYSPWSSKIYSLREVPPTPTHRQHS